MGRRGMGVGDGEEANFREGKGELFVAFAADGYRRIAADGYDARCGDRGRASGAGRCEVAGEEVDHCAAFEVEVTGAD